MKSLIVWYFLICIFPGGLVGLFITEAYEDETDTEHWFGMFYWPILLLILIVKSIIHFFEPTEHYPSGHGFTGNE